MSTDSERPVDEETRPDEASTDGGNAVGSADRTQSATQSRDLRTYLNYAVLVGLCLLALVATLQFYLSASRAIDVWVTPEYRPLFSMLFNLVVLFVVGAGITLQLRRLYGE
jgi:hypothetical protein